ncbi:hypothetical protein ACPZ19_22865 [Amycolatopsis lurida]
MTKSSKAATPNWGPHAQLRSVQRTGGLGRVLSALVTLGDFAPRSGGEDLRTGVLVERWSAAL